MKKNIILMLIFASLLLVNCKENAKKTEKQFDVDLFLKEVTYNVIIPSIESFQNESEILVNKANTYTKSPTEENLKAIRLQWVKVAYAYEQVYNFNFGPSKSKYLHQAIYNWPTVPHSIENIITSKAINPESMAKVGPQIKGIAALEYLLFKEELAEVNNTMVNQPKRRAYLFQSTLFLKYQAERLLKIWSKDGSNYAETFINNKDTGLNNSFNLLFNGLYNAANTAKVTKIGKPGGLEKSIHTNPEKVQAPYSKESLALTLQSIQVIDIVFFSDAFPNISQYITSISKNETVNERVKTAIKEIKQAVADIPVPLQDAVDSHPEQVKKLYSKITALNIWMAVDCRSILSIIITSTDNDGD